MKLVEFRHEYIILRRERIAFKFIHISGPAEHRTYLFPVLELRLYQSYQIIRFKRLCNISISTATEALDLIFHSSLGCEENDRVMAKAIESD